MESFDISINMEGMPDELRIVPLSSGEEDTKYEVYNDQDYLGTVWPECMEEGVCWFSSDELSEDTVLKIGEAIERADR